MTKRTIGGDFLPQEEQLWPKKPNVVRPFSHSASSFQPWQPCGNKGLGISEPSNNAEPSIQNAINSNSSVAQDCNNINMNIENSTLDHAKKNHIIGEGANSDQPQADQPGNCNTESEMDPKRLKRMLANRASAQRSRMRKMEYMEELEKKAKSYQDTIAALHPQTASCKNRQWFLLIEQHKLKLQMAAREKERILQEVEIEKNKDEVNRLSELQRKLIASRARMVNMDATMHLMSKSNSNTSDFGRFICLNSAQNGIGTSRMQTDMGQHFHKIKARRGGIIGTDQHPIRNL